MAKGIDDKGEEYRCIGHDKGDRPGEIRAVQAAMPGRSPGGFRRYRRPGGKDLLRAAHAGTLIPAVVPVPSLSPRALARRSRDHDVSYDVAQPSSCPDPAPAPPPPPQPSPASRGGGRRTSSS